MERDRLVPTSGSSNIENLFLASDEEAIEEEDDNDEEEEDDKEKEEDEEDDDDNAGDSITDAVDDVAPCFLL